MFKQGQKIVCIKSSVNGKVNVREGEIYTVICMTCNGLGVMVEEAVSEFIINGFGAHLFRPLDKTWAEEILCKITEELDVDELIAID